MDMILRILLFGALTLFGTLSVSAAPEPYNRVNLEATIASEPTVQTEVKALSAAAVTLDVAAETIEFGASNSFQAIRAFDLADASQDGASFLTQTSSAASGCVGASPCPETLSISNRYLTLAGSNGLYQLKGLLAPANEMFFGVQAVEGRAQGEASLVALEALVAKPASLALSDLTGSYALVSFENEFEYFSNGDSSEASAIDQLTLNFAGDGTCSGGSGGRSTLLQETYWPSVDSRSAVFADPISAATFVDCNYTVDSAAGTTTVTLEISDGGDTSFLPITLFVSSQSRYLAGRVARDTQEDGVAVSSELATYLGVKLANQTLSNSDLAGIYFASSVGAAFSGADGFGVDSDFVTRTAIDFSGAAPDANGFSVCTIVGRGYASAVRSLGGSVPGVAVANLAFTGDDAVPFNGCRYRVDSAFATTLELISQSGETTRVNLSIGGDREMLVGANVATSEDPLPLDVFSELFVPSLAVSELFVLQRYSGAIGDAAVSDFAAPIVPSLNPGVLLAASVLPGSRSVELNQTATAFASVINFGSADGVGCDIRYGGGRSLEFGYQETLANNAPTGQQNRGVDIAAGATQTFFFSLTPFEAFSSEEIELNFSCVNSGSAQPVVGLNTLLLSSTSSPGPDVIALGATVSNDGIVRLPNRSGFFSLASFNVGVQDNMTVSVDTGTANIPVTVSLCESNPTTGACVNPTVPSTEPVSLSVGAGAAPTFAVFVSASDDISLDPANKRIFVRFNDSTGVVRGSTSVAVQTE